MGLDNYLTVILKKYLEKGLSYVTGWKTVVKDESYILKVQGMSLSVCLCVCPNEMTLFPFHSL